MRKQEITKAMKDALDKCPNCNGELEFFRPYKLRCAVCGFDYDVTSKGERWGSWALIGGLLLFVCALCIGVML